MQKFWTDKSIPSRLSALADVKSVKARGHLSKRKNSNTSGKREDVDEEPVQEENTTIPVSLLDIREEEGEMNKSTVRRRKLHYRVRTIRQAKSWVNYERRRLEETRSFELEDIHSTMDCDYSDPSVPAGLCKYEDDRLEYHRTSLDGQNEFLQKAFARRRHRTTSMPSSFAGGDEIRDKTTNDGIVKFTEGSSSTVKVHQRSWKRTNKSQVDDYNGRNREIQPIQTVATLDSDCYDGIASHGTQIEDNHGNCNKNDLLMELQEGPHVPAGSDRSVTRRRSTGGLQAECLGPVFDLHHAGKDKLSGNKLNSTTWSTAKNDYGNRSLVDNCDSQMKKQQAPQTSNVQGHGQDRSRLVQGSKASRRDVLRSDSVTSSVSKAQEGTFSHSRRNRSRSVRSRRSASTGAIHRRRRPSLEQSRITKENNKQKVHTMAFPCEDSSFVKAAGSKFGSNQDCLSCGCDCRTETCENATHFGFYYNNIFPSTMLSPTKEEEDVETEVIENQATCKRRSRLLRRNSTGSNILSTKFADRCAVHESVRDSKNSKMRLLSSAESSTSSTKRDRKSHGDEQQSKNQTQGTLPCLSWATMSDSIRYPVEYDTGRSHCKQKTGLR